MHRANNSHRWAVILAGGDGVRLRSLTRLISGDERPKQFCPLLGGRTLLTRTKQRVARGVSENKTLFVVLNSHEPFYSKELRNVPEHRILVQPSNRGTLPAILWSLMELRARDSEALAGFFPSDHHYAQEDRFLAGIDLAFQAAQSYPSIVLLGAAAKHAACDYGWIEAEAHLSEKNGVLRVKRFWEKPSSHVAEELLDRGCIWNTFVMMGRVQAFLDVVRSAAPEMYDAFDEIWRFPSRANSIQALYERLEPADFSRLVLSGPQAGKLGVFSLGDVGWTDLGDPRRVLKVAATAGAGESWTRLWGQQIVPEAS